MMLLSVMVVLGEKVHMDYIDQSQCDEAAAAASRVDGCRWA